MNGLRVNALGGEITARAETFGKLEDFHLAGASTIISMRDGCRRWRDRGAAVRRIVSGPFDATGKLSESEFHQIVAGATLTFAPAAGRRASAR